MYNTLNYTQRQEVNTVIDAIINTALDNAGVSYAKI